MRKRIPLDAFDDLDTNEVEQHDVEKRKMVSHHRRCGGDLVEGHERLKRRLEKTNDELDRCREERARDREVMMGIIDRLTQPVR